MLAPQDTGLSGKPKCWPCSRGRRKKLIRTFHQRGKQRRVLDNLLHRSSVSKTCYNFVAHITPLTLHHFKMIRLPPTGIDISQNDLNFHLQQLDIYQGLLKQGFKKNEIIKYFKDQSTTTDKDEAVDVIPSTVELCASSKESMLLESGRNALDASSPDPLHGRRSPSLTPEQPTGRDNSRTSSTQHMSLAGKGYTPRQSSLLQYSRGVSSDTASDGSEPGTRIPFSPRANIRYRPRSQTYSHEQSEMDENDFIYMTNTSLLDLHHLSLDDDLVPASTVGATIRVISDLRPEAESFTPTSLHGLNTEQIDSLKGKEKADSDESETSSLPSSPPLFPVHRSQRSPSLPRAPRTPATLQTTEPVTARRQQFLDGTFTIYDDSLPARLQPQTPADISHGPVLNATNAAFTAPPGMLRSPLPFQGTYVHGTRQPSGDQSPTTRALLIRERRQREFDRGARVEELRVNRVRTDQTLEDMPAIKDFWRDDLDADGVGEENFDESFYSADARRLRTISGNRRP